MIALSSTATTSLVTVSGDLDIAARDRLPELVARLRRLRRQLVVVDLCETTFVDSTGAAFLAAVAQATARHGGVTVLRGASERAWFVLEVCGALGLFRPDRTHGCGEGADPGASGEATLLEEVAAPVG